MPPALAAALDAPDKAARLAALRGELARRGVLVATAATDELRTLRAEPDPIATGVVTVDELLAGGFPRRAMTEVLGTAACGKTSLVLPALARLTREGALAAIVDPAAEVYPPAFAAAGVLLDRLLFVRPPVGQERRDPTDSLWAAEVLLQSGCFEAVVLDTGSLDFSPPRVADRQLLERRAMVLRAAAETHGAALIVLGEDPLGAPPAVRLRVSPGRVTVEKSRYGTTGRTLAVQSVA